MSTKREELEKSIFDEDQDALSWLHDEEPDFEYELVGSDMETNFAEGPIDEEFNIDNSSVYRDTIKEVEKILKHPNVLKQLEQLSEVSGTGITSLDSEPWRDLQLVFKKGKNLEESSIAELKEDGKILKYQSTEGLKDFDLSNYDKIFPTIKYEFLNRLVKKLNSGSGNIEYILHDGEVKYGINKNHDEFQKLHESDHEKVKKGELLEKYSEIALAMLKDIEKDRLKTLKIYKFELDGGKVLFFRVNGRGDIQRFKASDKHKEPNKLTDKSSWGKVVPHQIMKNSLSELFPSS